MRLVAQLERIREALVFPKGFCWVVGSFAVDWVVLDHRGDVEVEELLGESSVR